MMNIDHSEQGKNEALLLTSELVEAVKKSLPDDKKHLVAAFQLSSTCSSEQTLPPNKTLEEIALSTHHTGRVVLSSFDNSATIDCSNITNSVMKAKKALMESFNIDDWESKEDEELKTLLPPEVHPILDAFKRALIENYQAAYKELTEPYVIK